MSESFSPIVRTFEVRCSVDHAFETWTRQINLWWPLARHSVSRDNATSVTIEPRTDGFIVETTRAGHEIVWGRVNLWEPPNRFGYLWRIGERDESQATRVTITFTALDPARTRVTIEHAGWEGAGPKALSRHRGNVHGWNDVIPAFINFVEESSAGTHRQ